MNKCRFHSCALYRRVPGWTPISSFSGALPLFLEGSVFGPVFNNLEIHPCIYRHSSTKQTLLQLPVATRKSNTYPVSLQRGTQEWWCSPRSQGSPLWPHHSSRGAWWPRCCRAAQVHITCVNQGFVFTLAAYNDLCHRCSSLYLWEADFLETWSLMGRH